VKFIDETSNCGDEVLGKGVSYPYTRPTSHFIKPANQSSIKPNNFSNKPTQSSFKVANKQAKQA
jgi:hypothetical protein